MQSSPRSAVFAVENRPRGPIDPKRYLAGGGAPPSWCSPVLLILAFCAVVRIISAHPSRSFASSYKSTAGCSYNDSSICEGVMPINSPHNIRTREGIACEVTGRDSSGCVLASGEVTTGLTGFRSASEFAALIVLSPKPVVAARSMDKNRWSRCDRVRPPP